MSWLLPTVALESCETTLRGRRSSIRQLAALPHISTAPPFAADDSAISDVIAPEDKPSSAATTITSSQSPTKPSLSPLLNAHVSDYFISTAVPRHNVSSRIIHSMEILAPTMTLPAGGSLSSHETPLPDLRSGSPVGLEHLKWRLASGFFAYFLCGWGDGGEIRLHFFDAQLTFFLSFISNGDSSTLCVQ